MMQPHLPEPVDLSPLPPRIVSNKRRKVCLPPADHLPSFLHQHHHHRFRQTSMITNAGLAPPPPSQLPVDPFDSEDQCLADRLRALQSLIPNGLQFQDDEILGVAIDYVKELEKEIQAFDMSSGPVTTAEWQNKGDDSGSTSSSSPSSSESEQQADVLQTKNPLQRRGLCLVPLSALAKAF